MNITTSRGLTLKVSGLQWEHNSATGKTQCASFSSLLINGERHTYDDVHELAPSVHADIYAALDQAATMEHDSAVAHDAGLARWELKQRSPLVSVLVSILSP